MLLKDCPVGSVVKLASYLGCKEYAHPWWKGNFKVELGIDGKFLVDVWGNIRNECDHREDYQFEIVTLAPDPRITFTVGGQEFYVGQRVWSTEDAGILKNGEEAEIVGAFPEGSLYGRKIGDWKTCILDPKYTSTTPPTPHEWKRGDWARHEARGVVFITGQKSYNDCAIFVTDDKGVGYHISPSELTFISHSEPPK